MPSRRPFLGLVRCGGCGCYFTARLTPITGGWRHDCPQCGPVVYHGPTTERSPLVIAPDAHRRRRRLYPIQPPRRPGRPRKSHPHAA